MGGSNCSVKKSPCMKEWMAQADLPKEAKTVKKMNVRSLLLYSNKKTLYFKEWRTASGALKEIYCLFKNLMLQRDPLNKSFSQKPQYTEKKTKAINPPKKQLFGESSCSKSHHCKCKCLQF